MDLNLSSILQETQKVTDSLAGVGTQILGINDDLKDISNQRTAIANSAAEAQGTKTEIDLRTTADQEARRRAIAARFGTDPSAAGWVIGQSVDSMRQAKAGADAANANIRAKEAVNFMDNPLQWIAGKMTVNKDYADYNYWATQYNNAEKLAKDTESMTQASFITSNALTSTVSQAYIDSSKILEMYKYRDAGLQSAAQGARWNLEGITAAANISKERLGLFYQGNNAIAQQKNQEIALAHLNLSREQFNLQKQAFDEKTTEDSLTTRLIARGFFNITGQAMDPVKAKEALALFKAKEPNILNYFKSGLDSETLGGKPIISLSPYTASTLYMQRKVQGLSPDQKTVMDQLASWRNDFESQAVQVKLQLDPKDPTAHERAFNGYVVERTKMATGNVDVGSVFAPATLKQVGATNKDVQRMPLWKNVIEPAVQGNINVDDPNTLFGLVTSALESGKIGYADATDLSTIYQAGLELNNQSKNFISMGMPAIRTYQTSISMPDQIGKTTINLADSRAVATALNQVSAKAAIKLLNQRTGNPFGLN